MKRVLVAGATGYLGRFVTREFKRRGYWVRVLARNPGKLAQAGHFLEPAIRDDVDEVFTGEVTRPETLEGLCECIDVVFSSIGITRQRDKLSYRDVDYQGNRNILDLALKSSVQKFIFVSVFNAISLRHIPIVIAREAFVDDLRNTSLDSSVIRPTGYFSDMTEFLKMALSGRIYLIGNGKKRLNPIHGADLAAVCVDAVTSQQKEIPVGGPATFNHREIAELAFSIAGRNPKITTIPAWPVNLAVKIMRPFSQRLYSLSAFFTSAMQMDFAAPETGNHTLSNYYKEVLPDLLRDKSEKMRADKMQPSKLNSVNKTGTMNLEQEAKLVERAKTDREAFGELYDGHYNHILNYVVRRIANVQVSQDITSEVFLKALRGIQKYRWDGIPFSAWLYRIASNEIANYYRNQKRQKHCESEQLKWNDTETPSVEAELIDAEEELTRNHQYLLLHQQLSILTLKYQEVITLRYFEKKQINEISQILEKKEGTVKSLLHRGLEKLGKNLKKSATF